MIIQVVMAIVCITAVLWIIGVGSLTVLHVNNKSIKNGFIWGAVTVLCIEEVAFFVSRLLNQNFDFLFWALCFIYGILIFYGGICVRKKECFKTFHACFHHVKNIEYSSIMLVSLFFIAYAICTQWSPGSDDGYYIVKVGEILRTGNIHLSMAEAANGTFESIYNYRSDVSSLAVIYAFGSRIFNIHYSIFVRFVIAAIIMELAMAVVVELSSSLFADAKQKWFYFFTYCIVVTFINSRKTGFGPYEVILLRYPWYGISVLGVLLLILWEQFYKLFADKEQCKKSYWIQNTVLVIAMLQCEIVSVYIVPCVYLIYGSCYLLSNRLRIDIHTILGAILSLIPVYISIPIVLNMYSATGGNMGMGTEQTWLNVWYDYAFMSMPTSVEMTIFVIMIIWLLITGGKIERQFMVLPVLVHMATLLNPFLFNFVTKHITSKTTYYRLFWLIPVASIIAYATTKMVSYVGWDKRFLMLTFTIMLLFSIKIGLLDADRCAFSANWYKMSNNAYEVAVQLSEIEGLNSERVGIVVPISLSNEIRIYSTNLYYPCGERSSKTNITGSTYTYHELYNSIYIDAYKSQRYLLGDRLELLQSLGAKYIIYDNTMNIPDDIKNNKIIFVGNYNIVQL